MTVTGGTVSPVPFDPMTERFSELIAGIESRSMGAIAQALTLIDRDPAAGEALRGELRAPSSTFVPVVVTGAPGAGKSSLLREVVRELRAADETVAVVAADPVSSITSGAFLGDRVRFGSVCDDSGVFLRSVALRDDRTGLARGRGGGTPVLEDALAILAAAGYDWTFLETVGVGQIPAAGLQLEHLNVLVLSPQDGDYIQMLKAGIMETASVFAVNKADRPGASRWARELDAALGGSFPHPRRIVVVSAKTGEGVGALVGALRQARTRPSGAAGGASQ